MSGNATNQALEIECGSNYDGTFFIGPVTLLVRNPPIEVERLDLAEKAQTTAEHIANLRIALIAFSIFLALGFLFSQASFILTWSVRILAVLCALTSIILWSHWRYKAYALPILQLAAGSAGFLTLQSHSHTFLSWTVLIGASLLFLFLVVQSWKRARAFAVVNSGEWNNATKGSAPVLPSQ
jgi:hypothetical protein